MSSSLLTTKHTELRSQSLQRDTVYDTNSIEPNVDS